MPRDEARTIKVRCATWDQVEAFYAEKLKGDSLVVKMPIQPDVGDGVTVALGLPNSLVFAIDGSVVKVGPKDPAGKFPVAMRMHGLTREVRERLARLVSDGRAGLLSQLTQMPATASEPRAAPAVSASEPASATPETPAAPVGPLTDEVLEPAPEPRLEDVIEDERAIYQGLDAALEGLLQLPAHEVLGVAWDAELRTVRSGYFALTKKYHPDIFGRYQSPALRLLASEVFIHINKAYDRMREAAVAAGGVLLPGPARRADGGWMATLDEVVPAESEPAAPPITLVADEPAAAAPSSAVPTPAAATGSAPIRPAAAAAGGGGEVPEEPDDNPFDSARMSRPLTAEALFGDMQLGGESGQQPAVTDGGGAPSGLVTRAEREGRAALAAGRYADARSAFAAALREEPRNRAARALYHVASGLELRERGKTAEATLQFETALAHDRDCPEALRALGRPVGAAKGDFKGIFGR